MNSENYAQALKEALENSKEDFEKIWHNFELVLKKRGATKLLPKILAILEKDLTQKNKKAVLTLASDKDKSLAQKITADEVKIDKTILGGYRFEKPGELRDASYKTKLLELYRTIVQK